MGARWRSKTAVQKTCMVVCAPVCYPLYCATAGCFCHCCCSYDADDMLCGAQPAKLADGGITRYG
jgi:hypothetical protein